jgi:APA family basic amino acid/polyamine antiporter
MNLFRTKPIQATSCETEDSLRRCLTAWDLTLLGIGAIIGAGVFVLTGIAAATKAGPAVIISYIISGMACLFSALAYAELAASVGGCGSAYSYSYASFGELIAWIIGWDLILEYVMSVSAVAIGWSGYVKNALESVFIHVPSALTKTPFEGGIMNLPAVLIIAILATLLCIGVKESSRFNAVIVFIKLFAIAIFILVAVQNIHPPYWQPFAPFGFEGIVQGAALVFFAYIGFDAVSTAAEEAINPQRDLPIGIIASVSICTVIYIVVAGLLTGIVPFYTLNNASPVADALLILGHSFAAGIVAVGAIAGLTTVMLVMYYGLTRVCLAISRDGLLPGFFFKIHPRTKTPVLIIVLSGIIIASIAGLMPLEEAAQLVNIGTLAAFTLVCGGVIFLRWTQPELPRPFKLPFFPLVPILGMFFCIYLMMHLSAFTWWRFVIWMAIGLLIYFIYGKNHAQT